jgi:hypothetical protein
MSGGLSMPSIGLPNYSASDLRAGDLTGTTLKNRERIAGADESDEPGNVAPPMKSADVSVEVIELIIPRLAISMMPVPRLARSRPWGTPLTHRHKRAEV